MTVGTRITVQPRAAGTGIAATIRLAGGSDPKACFDGTNHYRAGLTRHVRISTGIGWDRNGWTGGAMPSTGTIAWAPSRAADLAAYAALYWPEAAVTVQESSAAGIYATRLVGRVADAPVQNGRLVITLADLAVGLSRPAVTTRFAGTGGAEGGADAKGRIKRRSLGRVFNLEGRVFDKVNNIYEFGDPSFPWQAFDAVRDGGREASPGPAPAVLPWQGSFAATEAALVASVPTQGSGVAAPSIAQVKWWTQPRGPLTADVRGEIGTGYVETAAEVASRLLAAVGGPAISNVAAAAALRPGAAGIHLDEGEDINSALNRLLLGVSLLWKLDPAAGTILLSEIKFTAPVASLVSDDVTRERTLPPVKTRRVGYRRSYKLHGDGDIVSTLLQSDPAAGTKLGGVADGATKNRPFEQSTDPALVPVNAVVNGDAWIDTSVTPKVRRDRIGGVWVAGSNLVTSGPDIGVAAGATAGRNLLLNPGAETGGVTPWILDQSTGGPFTFVADTTGPVTGKYRFLLSKTNTTHGIAAIHPAIQVTPGKKYLVRVPVSGNGSASATGLYIRINQRASAPSAGYVTTAQASGGTTDLNNGGAGNGPVTAGYTTHLFTYTVPAGITFVSPAVYNWQGAPLGVGWDDFEFYELTDYEIGADVTANANPTQSGPPSQTFNYNSDLSAKSGQLPRTLVFKRYKGTTDVTQDSDVSWSRAENGCTATINNTNGSGLKGNVTVTAVASSGSITVTSTKAGAAPLVTVVDVFRSVDTATSAGGAGATGFDTFPSGAVTSTTSAAPTTIATGTMRSSSGGQAVFRGEIIYPAPGVNETATLYVKWQKSLAGANSWSDATSYVAGSQAFSGSGGLDDFGYSGTCSVAGTATGLTASTDYDFRLVAYRAGVQCEPWADTALTGRQT